MNYTIYFYRIPMMYFIYFLILFYISKIINIFLKKLNKKIIQLYS